ncbi:YsnF/AvaK domain-containing protein [Devosia submarina]|uniref:YsnF/AvaK domain-containing protein n=1 Tax=Devosia submarina TaxID=1173082 RepID=UPI001FE72BDE|nr:YsnF/AvaK domain-containing protein [Devosia submarina]
MSQISANSTRTISAMFDSRNDAQRAVDRLLEAGIPQANVRLVPGYENDTPVTNRSEQHKGFFSSLADLFMPDEDRYTYAEGLSRGGYMVVASDIDMAYYDRAIDILDDEGSIDLDQREQSWRSEGWTGFQTDATGSSYSLGADTMGASAATSTDRDIDSTAGFGTTNDEVIPVVNERLVVGKRDVNLGRVRVRSYLREEPVSEDVNLHEERVTLERRPVDRPLTDADAAFRDRTIEAEAHAEEAVIGKEARVTEEISLRKESTDHQETISDTVRKTEVEIEDDRSLDSERLSRR